MLNQILNERYQIQKELGRQTGRRTFLAEDLQTQEKVVIKLLLLGEDFDWQDLKLFEREAETLKTLNHPNIPRYLDYFELDHDDEKGFGLVQTYVEGKTLEQHLKSGRTFNETEVKELAISLLQILSYLHQHEPSVIHRDIKPSNILLTNRSGNSPGQVYLVDFGSVQTIAATNGGTITVVGTYGYMPPEQFGGRCVEASDLYSLGATLIFLITGLHPTEFPQKDLQIQFRQTANFSEQFADWLEWMTEPSLSQRYKSTQEAIKALESPVPRKKDVTLLPQKVSKPLSSEIKLYNDIDGLEIVIPPQGFRIFHIALISLASPIAMGLLTFSIRPTSQHFAAFLMQVFAVIMIIFLVLQAFFERTQIIISKNSITYINEMLGIKRRSYRQNLQKGIHESGATSSNFVIIGDRRLFSIGADLQEFNSSIYNNLTTEELQWLSQEISDYLDIPISKV